MNLLKSRFHKIYALVAIHENLIKFFITYILSNTRFLKQRKKVSFSCGVGKRWIIIRQISIV